MYQLQGVENKPNSPVYRFTISMQLATPQTPTQKFCTSITCAICKHHKTSVKWYMRIWVFYEHYQFGDHQFLWVKTLAISSFKNVLKIPFKFSGLSMFSDTLKVFHLNRNSLDGVINRSIRPLLFLVHRNYSHNSLHLLRNWDRATFYLGLLN